MQWHGMDFMKGVLRLFVMMMTIVVVIIIIITIIISCHTFSFFPGISPLDPVVNPTTQDSSLTLQHFPYDV
jgi:hypothetical protein